MTGRTLLVVLVALALAVGAGPVQAQVSTPNNGTGDSPLDTEPNDGFANATAVGDGTYGGLTITEGDVNVYAVNVTAGQQLSARIEFESSVGDLDMVLVDPDRVVPLAVSDGIADNESITYVPRTNATYYVGVYGFANATGSYTLTVNGTAEDARDETAETPVFEPIG
jgi:hypothetical protein